MLLLTVTLHARRRLEAQAQERRRMTTLVVWWGVLIIAVFAAGAGMAAPTSAGAAGAKSPAVTSVARSKAMSPKTRRVAHSPYALAAGARSAAPAAGNPIKGHSATMVQGLGTSGLRKHSVARPH